MLWMIPSQLLRGLVGFTGPDSSQSIALVNLILSGLVVVLLLLALPWRRMRWPVPMPWHLASKVSSAGVAMGHNLCLHFGADEVSMYHLF